MVAGQDRTIRLGTVFGAGCCRCIPDENIGAALVGLEQGPVEVVWVLERLQAGQARDVVDGVVRQQAVVVEVEPRFDRGRDVVIVGLVIVGRFAVDADGFTLS